ncbi:MAG: hypothetical protein V4616_08995, partial [Bacteroidota bacterium]
MRSIIAFCSLITITASAQHKAIVYFRDKPDSPGFSLSAAASERRAKHHITYDQSDLPVNADYIKQLSESGFRIIHTSKWLNAVLVDGKRECSTANFSFIDRVDPLNRKKLQHSSTMSVETQAAAAFSDKNFAMHHGKVLAENGYTGKGIHIAVFDAGFPGVNTLEGYAKLRNEGRIFHTRDVVGGTPNVYQYDQHGTQTLSVMAGYLPDRYTGTAVEATFSLFVTENASSETPVEEFNWVV